MVASPDSFGFIPRYEHATSTQSAAHDAHVSSKLQQAESQRTHTETREESYRLINGAIDLLSEHAPTSMVEIHLPNRRGRDQSVLTHGWSIAQLGKTFDGSENPSEWLEENIHYQYQLEESNYLKSHPEYHAQTENLSAPIREQLRQAAQTKALHKTWESGRQRDKSPSHHLLLSTDGRHWYLNYGVYNSQGGRFDVIQSDMRKSRFTPGHVQEADLLAHNVNLQAKDSLDRPDEIAAGIGWLLDQAGVDSSTHEYPRILRDESEKPETPNWYGIHDILKSGRIVAPELTRQILKNAGVWFDDPRDRLKAHHEGAQNKAQTADKPAGQEPLDENTLESILTEADPAVLRELNEELGDTISEHVAAYKKSHGIGESEELTDTQFAIIKGEAREAVAREYLGRDATAEEVSRLAHEMLLYYDRFDSTSSSKADAERTARGDKSSPNPPQPKPSSPSAANNAEEPSDSRSVTPGIPAGEGVVVTRLSREEVDELSPEDIIDGEIIED